MLSACKNRIIYIDIYIYIIIYNYTYIYRAISRLSRPALRQRVYAV